MGISLEIPDFTTLNYFSEKSMALRCSVFLFLMGGLMPAFSQEQVHLPFGPMSLSHLRSSIPIGDLLSPQGLSPDRKQELNALFQEVSDSIFRSPKDGALYLRRGRVRMELGAMRSALDDFELARSRGYRKRETYFHLGVVNATLGERAFALAFFNICLKKDSTDAEVHHYLGITKLYLKHGSAEERCADAIPEFSKALQYDPLLRDALILRGCAYDRLGDHEAAIVDFKRALEMAPGNGRAAHIHKG